MTKDIKHDSKETEIVEIKDSVDEINYDAVLSGPLYIDPLHKEPGFVYQFVADRPGDIVTYQRWGYSVVQDLFKVGDDVASKTSRFGSAVTVQSKCGTLLVLMKITEENHQKLMAHRKKQHDSKMAALGNVPTDHGSMNGEFKIVR